MLKLPNKKAAAKNAPKNGEQVATSSRMKRKTESPKAGPEKKRNILKDVSNIFNNASKKFHISKVKRRTKALPHLDEDEIILEDDDDEEVVKEEELDGREKLEDSKIRDVPAGVRNYDEEFAADPSSEANYVQEIFKYYREEEKKFVVPDYFEMQTQVTRAMRAVLVDWMVEVQGSFVLNHETLYLAVKMLDLYLSKNVVPKDKLQLIGATGIFVACKFDERCSPKIEDYLYICDDAFSREELITMERKILLCVDFHLGLPLSYRFLRRYARTNYESLEMLTLARYILETSLLEYDLVKELESKVAAASLLLARKMLKKEIVWTKGHEHYTGYKEEQLSNLVIFLNTLILSSASSELQTIRKKYSDEVFSKVAKIQPLPLSSF